MEILITKMTIGAEDEFGNIYETWIYGKLKSGLFIEIFVDERFDLQEFNNQKIECLISASKLYDIQIERDLIVDINKERIIGKYFGKFIDSEGWNLGNRSEWFFNIETIDGIILLYKDEFEEIIFNQIKNLLNRPLDYGDIFSFRAEEFELEAWRSI